MYYITFKNTKYKITGLQFSVILLSLLVAVIAIGWVVVGGLNAIGGPLLVVGYAIAFAVITINDRKFALIKNDTARNALGGLATVYAAVFYFMM